MSGAVMLDFHFPSNPPSISLCTPYPSATMFLTPRLCGDGHQILFRWFQAANDEPEAGPGWP